MEWPLDGSHQRSSGSQVMSSGALDVTTIGSERRSWKPRRHGDCEIQKGSAGGLAVETRGPDHRDEALAELARRGIHVRVDSTDQR